MKIPLLIKQLFYQSLHLFYQASGISKHKVMVKSIKGTAVIDGVSYPQREFYALDKRGHEMGYGKVRVGSFQEYKYQYCIFNGTVVKPLYRRRYLASKLTQARIDFCMKEGFDKVLVPVEANNIASIRMFELCGFVFNDKGKWFSWMVKEWELMQKPNMLIGYYQIKKPAL